MLTRPITHTKAMVSCDNTRTIRINVLEDDLIALGGTLETKYEVEVTDRLGHVMLIMKRATGKGVLPSPRQTKGSTQAFTWSFAFFTHRQDMRLPKAQGVTTVTAERDDGVLYIMTQWSVLTINTPKPQQSPISTMERVRSIPAVEERTIKDLCDQLNDYLTRFPDMMDLELHDRELRPVFYALKLERVRK